MEDLRSAFRSALAADGKLAPNHILRFLAATVESVAGFEGLDNAIDGYISRMSLIACTPNFALDRKLTCEFAQLLGEANFYCQCRDKRVSLVRVPESTEQRPDFYHEASDSYFEVKTLSVVDGELGVEAMLTDAMNTTIEAEDRLRRNGSVGIGIGVHQPYGKKPYRGGQGHRGAVVDTILEKIRGNLKVGQFPNERSFLVIDLCMLPVISRPKDALRPAYCSEEDNHNILSGELWLTAFGVPGFPVFDAPEFEGRPTIANHFEKRGFLNDADYGFIAGAIFALHSMSSPVRLLGLFRPEHLRQHDTACEALMAIVGHNWNDSNDSNGWKLQSSGSVG